MKDHPLNPMRDANLVARVGAPEQKARRLGPDRDQSRKDRRAVSDRLDALAAEGKGAAIADAIFDSDLEILGRAALGRRVSCGASGLGLGLARALVADSATSTAADAASENVGGLVACLSGSCSQATLAQMAAAEALMPVRHPRRRKASWGR
ncbi:MAG: four-carbon acid sugar kinase family protein [Alphaproteobacteria bacterium]